MKRLAALSLAAALTAGSMTSASAFAPEWIDGESAASMRLGSAAEPTHFDPCHGRTSGTAHHSCGTATGGPAGGLF